MLERAPVTAIFATAISMMKRWKEKGKGAVAADPNARSSPAGLVRPSRQLRSAEELTQPA